MALDSKESKAMYFRQILQDLTGSHSFDYAQLSPLISQMDRMSGLLATYMTGESAEDLAETGAQIISCQQEGAPIVNAFLSQYGVNTSDAEEYFNNPDNLNAKEWELVQA